MNALSSDALAGGLAFAGTAFLSSDAAQLAALLDELRVGGGGDEEATAALAHAFGSGELEPEFTRLFYDPLGAVCPPWQSARGEEPRLMGASHVSAMAWYRQAGIEPQRGNEPADHIGLLLLFAAYLLRNGDAALPRFVEEHMAWMPEYLGGIAAETAHPFYAALASFTAARLGLISSSPTPATA